MIASEIYFKRMGSLLPSLCTCGCSLYQSTSMGGNFHNNKIRREKVEAGGQRSCLQQVTVPPKEQGGKRDQKIP